MSYLACRYLSRVYTYRYTPLLIILYVVYCTISRPSLIQFDCPDIPSLTAPQHVSDVCEQLISNDSAVVKYASQFTWCAQGEQLTETLSDNCTQFQLDHGYQRFAVTSEEIDFPLAFSILVHDDVEQFERLLSAIYRPHNYYCIHVDKKASLSLKRIVSAIVACFTNVVQVADPYSVHWAEFSVLQAELACMKELMLWKKWRYFINLTGHEYPIRTNLELVQILKSYNGANDIDGTHTRRNTKWTEYVWYTENWMSSIRKEDPPHKFVINKGSAHIVACRSFVDYVLNDRRAQDLLDWMRDVRVPDEHYFATLNHNPTRGVPGAYTGLPSSKSFLTRLKVWEPADGSGRCGGRWLRFICNFGPADLHDIVHSKFYFANKFHRKRDFLTFGCMEYWYNIRAQGGATAQFDLNFYAQRPWVKKHT